MAFKFNWINEFIFNIQRGVTSKFEIINIEGQNDSIMTAFETVWTEGGVYPFQDNAESITVVSDDATDTISGIGVQKIELKMLDDLGIEQIIIVDMNGLTPVAIPGIFKAINSCKGIQGGSDKFNNGKITVTHNAVNTLAVIDPQRGKSLQAIYTVPFGKSAFIFAGNYTSAGLDNGFLEAYIMEPGGIWVSTRIQNVHQSAAQLVIPYNKLLAGTQIEIRGKSNGAGAVAIAAGFSINLRKD